MTWLSLYSVTKTTSSTKENCVFQNDSLLFMKLINKKISNDQELTQSDPISRPKNQREITKYIN